MDRNPKRGNSVRPIAFYLPQFHPVPENDEWWGPGFTEWTNVAKAAPLFSGHHQPRIPADLGFYDLRVPEVRASQANLAKKYGVEGFCYWHYWFEGRRLLERPFEEVLASGEPELPFMLGWANQTWSGVWHGNPGRVLIEQTYGGVDDYLRHFDELAPSFHDSRYLRIEDKPLFLVFRPQQLPRPQEFAATWRQRAEEAGLRGIYLIGQASWDWDPGPDGFDACIDVRLPSRRAVGRVRHSWRRMRGLPLVWDYRDAVAPLEGSSVSMPNRHACVIPDWDHTPRSGNRGLVLRGATPEKFGSHVARVVSRVEAAPTPKRLLFIKSWNEWAEGNYLEPDRRWGLGYLEALAQQVLGYVPSPERDWIVY